MHRDGHIMEHFGATPHRRSQYKTTQHVLHKYREAHILGLIVSHYPYAQYRVCASMHPFIKCIRGCALLEPLWIVLSLDLACFGPLKWRI